MSEQASEAARLLNSLRRPRAIRYQCETCGRTFTATQKAKTCTAKCRKAYWRRQHRAKKA